MKMAWQKKSECGHIVSTVRKQRDMNAGGHLISFPSIILGPQPWDTATHIPGNSCMISLNIMEMPS